MVGQLSGRVVKLEAILDGVVGVAQRGKPRGKGRECGALLVTLVALGEAALLPHRLENTGFEWQAWARILIII